MRLSPLALIVTIFLLAFSYPSDAKSKSSCTAKGVKGVCVDLKKDSSLPLSNQRCPLKLFSRISGKCSSKKMRCCISRYPPRILHPQNTFAPQGRLPLSDKSAAHLVTRRPEIRPQHKRPNNYVPSNKELSAFYNAYPPYSNDTLRRYVTGRPGLRSPSTDDLIQWAAHKWGIPEDWIRAEMVQESHWNQSMLGDLTSVSCAVYNQYPPQARHSKNAHGCFVYQSMGVMQCKWIADPNNKQGTGIGAGTEPLRWKSTAFNLDFYGHYVRWLFDGGCNWCNRTLYVGNAWQSIGGWFGDNGDINAQNYIKDVQGFLAGRNWTKKGF